MKPQMQHTSDVKKILILASNPKDTKRIRFDEEIREIDEGLRRANRRDQFILKTKLALRVQDLRRALLDESPQFVHFIGHGEPEGLKLESKSGKAEVVPPEAVSSLFQLFSDVVECVILSACHSLKQSTAINRHIPYVIGMRHNLPDKAGIEFAVGFYDALGAGRPVEDAFKFGRNAIMLTNPDPDLPLHQIAVLGKKTP